VRGRIAIAAASAALALAGCGGGGSPTAPAVPLAPSIRAVLGSITQGVIDGQNFIVAHPRRPTDKVVVFIHAFNFHASTPFFYPGLASLTAALLRHGYAFASDDAHITNWGSSASVLDYLRLAQRLEQQHLRIYVLAHSMGGLDAMLLLNYLRPAAWAAMGPVCDLRSVWSEPGFRPSIRSAYPTLDFAGRAPVRVGSSARGLPMLFISSPQDTVVPAAENADVCAAEAQRSGADVQRLNVTGSHESPSQYQAARILATFARG
jgi:pimeloyl-ACP methyl ester carboxylesterase